MGNVTLDFLPSATIKRSKYMEQILYFFLWQISSSHASNQNNWIAHRRRMWDLRIFLKQRIPSSLHLTGTPDALSVAQHRVKSVRSVQKPASEMGEALSFTGFFLLCFVLFCFLKIHYPQMLLKCMGLHASLHGDTFHCKREHVLGYIDRQKLEIPL